MQDFPILDWHINDAFTRKHGVAACIAALGHIPEFVTVTDPRPAWEQFDERYIGGWSPMLPAGDKGWQLNQDNYLLYPGDPPLVPLAHAYLRDELILVYPYAWVCIVQPSGDFSVARMD